ncbi:MAG: hypothetical protein AB7Q01_13675 [Gammaproteobacteria bacterium]
MPWSTFLSVPLGGVAGRAAGDITKTLLEDQHWLVQRVASGLAEAAATYVTASAVNAVGLDPLGAATVTPAQAMIQGAVRATTGDSLVHPETFVTLFENR